MTYQEKIDAENKIYSECTKVHDLPPSFRYVVNAFLVPHLMATLGVASFYELISKYSNLFQTPRVASFGAGNCDFEIECLNKGFIKGHIDCYEINTDMLDRGRVQAQKFGLETQISFLQADINKICLDSQQYDIVIANHSLHHFVELEHFFSEIKKCMAPESYFVINDMIGRNGHMFYEDTLDVCNRIWSILPCSLKYNYQLKRFEEQRTQWDCSKEGFEGIRAQDILPLLRTNFTFIEFAPFFTLIDRFIGRDFGANFDHKNLYHKSILDMVAEFDSVMLEKRLLKPVQMMAVVTPYLKDGAVSYNSKVDEILNIQEGSIYKYLNKLAGLDNTGGNQNKITMEGFYDDHWMGKTASIHLVRSTASSIRLAGHCPDNFPNNRLTVTVKGSESVVNLIPGKSFDFSVYFENTGELVIIRLVSDVVFNSAKEGTSADGRDLGIYINTIEFS